MIYLKKTIAIGCILIICTILIFKYSQKPNNNRDWLPRDQKMSNINFDQNGIVTIYNVRDFQRYDENTFNEQFVTRTFPIDEITGVDFYLSTFALKQKIGHTYLVFNTQNDNNVAVSIEARKESTESYSPLRGLLNQYELYYLFATPEDLTSLRTDVWNEPVYKYSLRITPNDAQSLFRSLAKTANELREKPKFYNTFTDNCTSVLRKHANKVNKGSIPRNFGLLLTGLSDYYLLKYGFLDTSDSKKLLRENHILNPLNKFTTLE